MVLEIPKVIAQTTSTHNQYPLSRSSQHKIKLLIRSLDCNLSHIKIAGKYLGNSLDNTRHIAKPAAFRRELSCGSQRVDSPALSQNIQQALSRRRSPVTLFKKPILGVNNPLLLSFPLPAPVFPCKPESDRKQDH